MTPRDREILRRYEAGEAQRSIAADFGITHSRVSQIVRAAGVYIGPERRKEHLRRFWSSLPHHERYALYCKGNKPGKRPEVWADCPAHLFADYMTLRKYFTATEARQMLETQP